MLQESECGEFNDDSTEISIKPEPACDIEEAEEEVSNDGQPPGKRTKVTSYSQMQLQLAYEAVQSGMKLNHWAHLWALWPTLGNTELNDACRMYGVPQATLKYRLTHRISGLEGRKTLLERSEELPMFKGLNELADAGFQLSYLLIQTFAKEFVKECLSRNPFPSGIPAKQWVAFFLKRHPELGKRESENWARYGRGKVKVEHVAGWLGCASRYLERIGVMSVLQNRQQVFTVDDVQLEMKKGRHEVTFTCLFGADAYGNLLPPLVLYPQAVTLPVKKEQAELKYSVAYQDTQLTAGNALYQWLSKVFQPWLIEENVPRPVILFVDGHRQQMGYRSSQFCQQHQIVPVSLLPRNDHLPRPLNAKLFGQMKKLWRDEVKKASKSKGNSVDQLLKQVLDQLERTENIIRSGFLKGDIYPWNPEGYTADDLQPEPIVVPKVRKNAKKPPPRKPIDPMVTLFRKMFEARLSVQQLAEFEAQRYDEMWQGLVEDANLFRMWRDLLNEIDSAEPEPGDIGLDDSALVEEAAGEFPADFVKAEPSADCEENCIVND